MLRQRRREVSGCAHLESLGNSVPCWDFVLRIVVQASLQAAPSCLIAVESMAEIDLGSNAMKMRPGTQTGFLLCGKEWSEGEALEVRSPWDRGLVARVTKATRADARQAVHHAVASLRRLRALPRWKRREIQI